MLKVSDRVRIVKGHRILGPPSYMIDQEAMVLRPAIVCKTSLFVPKTMVRLDSGQTFACYDDEMELLPLPDTDAERAQAETLLNALDETWGI